MSLFSIMVRIRAILLFKLDKSQRTKLLLDDLPDRVCLLKIVTAQVQALQGAGVPEAFSKPGNHEVSQISEGKVEVHERWFEQHL